MAAFETTSVVIPRADQPNIVQRFLLTSERFLFNPPVAVSVRVRAKTQAFGVPRDGGEFNLPSLRCIPQGTQSRAVK